MKFKNVILYITVITLTFELNSCASYKEFESFKSQTNIAILPPGSVNNKINFEPGYEFGNELKENFTKSLAEKLQYVGYNTFIIEDTLPDSIFLAKNCYIIKPIALKLKEDRTEGKQHEHEPHTISPHTYYNISHNLNAYGDLIKKDSNNTKVHYFDVVSNKQSELSVYELTLGRGFSLKGDLSAKKLNKKRYKNFETLSHEAGRLVGQDINRYFRNQFKITMVK